MASTGKSIKAPKSKTLRCKTLHEYLKSLSPNVLDRLYNHPSTCLAVYRELSEIAKHYVIRLLFVEQPVPQAVIASWLSKTHAKEHKEATDTLTELRVWNEASVPGGMSAWILNPIFKRNAKVALLGGGRPWSMSAKLEQDQKSRDLDFLNQYALERWECILRFMVGSQQTEGISADAVRTLLHAELMKCNEGSESPVITKDGFQFLLLETPAQVWYFILKYLETVESKGLDLVECLTFLFQLKFSTLGTDYSTEGMSEKLQIFLQHLREFGLVYQRKRKAGRYYPTKLALNMATRGTLKQIREPGFLIVETNFRVYAYTDSNLKVALIGLFTELMYRFPNLTVGVLTRDSVRAALRSGITAAQIIGFLRLHALPTIATPLPPVVADQIQLWEGERERLTTTEGVLYSQFVSQADFEKLRDYAQDLGVLTWQNEKKRTVVVTKQGHSDVKKFWVHHQKGSQHS
uniref:General transcription factor IIH subunit 4 n=1 Tax=Cacopsylla melanoneura TaxID=428564 RepID=A0A8D9DV28_9HEMI